MGARTLEARLTGRLLLLAGTVLVLVGVAAVVVTDRVLDASDTAQARAVAIGARDMLRRELHEGDALDDAIEEVVGSADGQRVRLTARPSGGRQHASGAVLPELASGACSTVVGDDGSSWRACEASQGSTSFVAGVPIAAHRQTVATLARGMIAVVLVALLALWLAVRRALRAPAAELRDLVGWTSRIVDSEGSVPPPTSTTREIAQLAEAFDALVRRLLEVLARERASSAHIAHELRTPLTSILAELESLPTPDDSSRQATSRMRSDVKRLADVIEAILVLSSSRAPARAGRAVVNVADLAREVAPPDVAVTAPDEALVEADERLIALALRNLLDNAQRHGRGARAVDVSRDGDALRLAVVDEGPGLDEASRARMFERYWRGTADGEGRGLGLALVRAVAERHGGEARAEPGPAGRGLRVSMTLRPLLGWHDGQP